MKLRQNLQVFLGHCQYWNCPVPLLHMAELLKRKKDLSLSAKGTVLLQFLVFHHLEVNSFLLYIF